MPAATSMAILAGTRPECLKLVSLVRAVRHRIGARTVLINSGQHLEMVRSSLVQWGLNADMELPAVVPGSLSAQVRWMREQVREACMQVGAKLLVVQGDTSTAYAGALAAKLCGIGLAHVEAGLRTADRMRPFPEEAFRRRIGALADWHFAPTAGAARNLLAEGVACARIFTPGNTGIDALRLALADPGVGDDLHWQARFSELLVLTLHRRENYGPRLEQICVGVCRLLDLHPELGVICPVHPNPAVGARVRRALAAHPRVWLTEPLAYRPFVHLLSQARLVVTDSGGIQEEAPYLGVPVVVARENTERPEALAGGHTRLVAVNAQAVFDAAQALLQAPRPQAHAFCASAPFGDGRAGERIAQVLVEVLANAGATEPVR